eukprot:2136988-Amphidinium_carterae.1
MTTVSPLTLAGNSDSSDRRTSLGKRRTQAPSTGYEPNGTVVPDEELIMLLMQATTPRRTAKLRRTCSDDCKDPQFDTLHDRVVGFSTTIELHVTEMTQEIKSIGDRGRQAAEALVSAYHRRTSLRSTDQKSAEVLEIEKLKHERDLLMGERAAAQAQLQKAAQFCNQVRAQALEHQNRMISEARNLSQYAANERRELLSSCQRKTEETVSC